jgi:hypothetical protein
MEPIYQVPTSKRPCELTRDQRLQVQTLFNNANYTVSQIVLQTGYTERQVHYALAHCLTPQKRKTGWKVLLNTL